MEHQDPSLGKYEIRPCEEGDVDIIDAKLDEAAYAIAPPVEGASDEEVVLKIEDEDGKIIAGCCLEFDSWNFVDIDILWVDEHCRGQGLGSALLREVERMARERGCYLAVLGTFSFQARGFYEKLGFTVFDAQEDYPKGCAHYCLMKRLDLPETAPRAESRFEIKRGADFLLIIRLYAHS